MISKVALGPPLDDPVDDLLKLPKTILNEDTRRYWQPLADFKRYLKGISMRLERQQLKALAALA